ncbi:MAG: hypothetical protein AB1644_01370 [Candidatus Zixiibacteriota bacterium]
MKRLLALLTVAVVAGMFMLLFGCSDKATENIVKVDGDTLDPTYLAAQTAFEGADEISTGLAEICLTLIDSVANDTNHPMPSHAPHFGGSSEAVASDSFLKTYHSDSKYWYFYASHAETLWNDSQQVVDVITFEVVDSLQFHHGPIIVQWPVRELLTEVHNIGSYSIDVLSGVGSLSAHQDLQIIGDVGTGGDVMVDANGSFNGEFNSYGAFASAAFKPAAESCQFSMNLSHVFDNVALNLTAVQDSNGCPTAGTITHSGNLNIACTGDTVLNFNDYWIITQAFHGDSSTVTFENSTTRWSAEHACHPDQPPAKLFASSSRFLRK